MSKLRKVALCALVALALILMPAAAMAEGATTGTQTVTRSVLGESAFTCVSTAFTTTSGGAYSGVVTMNGEIDHFTVLPDDTDFPTAAWDLDIADENAVDLISTSGDNLTTYTHKPIPIATGIALGGRYPVKTITITVANGGDAKKGIVKVYVKTKR